MPEPKSNQDGVCIVGLPAKDDPINGVGDVDKHVTLVWLGNTDEFSADPADIDREVAAVATDTDPFTVRVASTGKLGDEGANVAFLNGDDVNPVREELLTKGEIKGQHDAVKQYPQFTPHVTASYDGEPPEPGDLPESIDIDRLGFWNGEDKKEYSLTGGPNPVAVQVASARWVPFSMTAAAPPRGDTDRVQIVLPVPTRSAASLTFGPEIPELYVPLIDLGSTEGMTRAKLDQVFETVGEVAASNQFSLAGSMPTEFGQDPAGGAWVRPDVDGLATVKSRLLSSLIKGGIRPKDVPDPVIALNNAAPLPDEFFDRVPERVYFDRLGVRVGDQVFDFTFGVLSSGALLADGSAYRNGDVIAMADIGLPDEDVVYPDAQRVSTEVSPEGRHFRIPMLVPEGVETGDGRIFDPLSLKTRDLPLPLMWQIKTGEAHNGSVLVGRIDAIDRVGGGLGNARGVFDVGPYAREAQRLVEHKFLRGVSADLDKFEAEAEMPDDDEVEIIIPTAPDENSEGGSKKTKTKAKPKRGRKITSTPVRISSARVMGATLVPKPAFQESYIELVDDPAPVEEEPIVADGIYVATPDAALTACALVAAAIPLAPPKVWFDRPVLNGMTPITVTDEGQVFGHIAAWQTDHIGLPFGTKPPRSHSGYAYFHTGVCRTAEGKDVGVGQLTLAGGHASLELSAAAAVKHYDDTASAVADVHAGEDSYGIWVAGALRPNVTPEQIRALRASAPSGDWRPIGRRLELVAICQVNVPGFPIARARVASGYVTALVAAGASAIAALRGPTLEDRLATLEHNNEMAAEKAQVASAATRVRERFYATHTPPPPNPEVTTLQAEIAAAGDDVAVDVRRALRSRAKQLGAMNLVPAAWLAPKALHEEFALVASSGADEISIFKNYSKKVRQEMAERGEALESGRYPIKDADDIRRSLRIFAREPVDTKAVVQKHIVKRAKELERLDLVPAAWQDVIELSVEDLTLDIELAVDDYLTLKNFSPDKRKKLAAKKHAMPDGSFPIENEADLKRAVQAYGRTTDKKKAAVRRHIIRRARGLNHPELIPDSWKAASVNNALAQLHRTSPDEDLIMDGLVMGFSSQAALTAALKFRRPIEFEETQHPRSDDTGKFVSVLARLKNSLKDQAGTAEAVEALDKAQDAVDTSDLKSAKEQADRAVKVVDDIADRTVNVSNRQDLKDASSDLGGAIADLPVEQGRDDAIKYRFTDLPQTLQQLIRDLMDRLADVVEPETFDKLAGPLRTYMSGGDLMGADEIQSYLAKMLGPLIMAAR